MDVNKRREIENALLNLDKVTTQRGKPIIRKAMRSMAESTPLTALQAVQSMSDEFGDYELSAYADRIMDRVVRSLRGPALAELTRQRRRH